MPSPHRHRGEIACGSCGRCRMPALARGRLLQQTWTRCTSNGPTRPFALGGRPAAGSKRTSQDPSAPSASVSGADAVHPATVLAEKRGLAGGRPGAADLVGSAARRDRGARRKVAARQIANAVGAPLAHPGTDGPLSALPRPSVRAEYGLPVRGSSASFGPAAAAGCGGQAMRESAPQFESGSARRGRVRPRQVLRLSATYHLRPGRGTWSTQCPADQHGNRVVCRPGTLAVPRRQP